MYKRQIQQKLMGITAETYGFGIRFFTIEKTINVIGKAAPHQKMCIRDSLKAAGVECFVQGVPTEPAVDLFKLL